MKYLYLIALAFFILGFVNIIFGILGFVCMLLPFVFLVKDGKKTWCIKYCPRANLFTVLFRERSIIGKTPIWFTKGKAKWIMITYFTLNLIIMFMSTLMVFKGNIAPIEQVRFFMFFGLPLEMPQLLQLGQMADWAVHFAYRLYSMMFTTTILGLVLGLLFLPRTWCTICPINTISDIALSDSRNRFSSQTKTEPVKT